MGKKLAPKSNIFGHCGMVYYLFMTLLAFLFQVQDFSVVFILILSQISATPRQIGPQTKYEFENEMVSQKPRLIGPQTKKEFENDMTTR